MRDYLSLVTFSHTIFALPFAIIGFTLGVATGQASFSWITLLLVVGCMVFARSAAMAFNRLVDARYDAANPRTSTRDIPAGRISAPAAAWFVVINCACFIACAYALNFLCFVLSPVALAVVLGYSYTKRFTWLCHLVLGIGLGLAPIGAYVAVVGEFGYLPVLYGAVVLLWVAGFDIVYALQDRDFDRTQGLSSVPTRFGESRSFWLSRGLHTGCVALLVLATYVMVERWPPAVGWVVSAAVVFAGALVYQHRLVRPGNLDKIDRAFFTTNGVASVAYATLVVVGIATAIYT